MDVFFRALANADDWVEMEVFGKEQDFLFLSGIRYCTYSLKVFSFYNLSFFFWLYQKKDEFFTIYSFIRLPYP